METFLKRIWSQGWIRWFLILPGSIAASFIAAFVFGLIATISAAGGEDELPNPSLKVFLLRSFLEPVVFVWTGVRIAPRFRFPIALLLSLAYAVFVAFTLFTLARQGSEDWRHLLAGVISCASLVGCCSWARKGKDANQVPATEH